MGMKAKKSKTSAQVKEELWSQPNKSQAKTLGPSTMGLKPQKKEHVPTKKDVNISAPSVEYKGFSKLDLNDRYYEKPDLVIHGKPTFWTADAMFFVYWQCEVGRWSICDAASLSAVRQGQLPGWAYK